MTISLEELQTTRSDQLTNLLWNSSFKLIQVQPGQSQLGQILQLGRNRSIQLVIGNLELNQVLHFRDLGGDSSCQGLVSNGESNEFLQVVELFGDGASSAKRDTYEATSYVIIFGGWNNSKNVLARLDEHGADRVVGAPRRVEPGRTYHFRIERVDGTLTVWVDDQVLLEMTDPEPLEGRGHDHFGFNNWKSDLWFDNLKVTPL